jgi:hypothetical protein
VALIGALIFLVGLVALIRPQWFRLPNRWWAAGVVVLGMVLVGATGESRDSPSQEAGEGATEEGVAREERTDANASEGKLDPRCILLDAGPILQVSTAVFDTMRVDAHSKEGLPIFIAHMLDLDGTASIRNVYAVRSPQHELVYFISAEIDAPGLEGEGDVGTWAKTGEIGEPGLMGSVGGTENLSRLLGIRSGVATITDEAAELSVECVQEAQKR